MKEILSKLRKAIQDYNLIEEGDVIGVGVSGGKDSITLLYALHLFQGFSPVKFNLHALTLTLGIGETNFSSISEFCNKHGIPHTLYETQIGKILFEYRKEKNPCSLCAKLRKGALNNQAIEKSCNKVALGHHSDDVIETLLLSMLYEGRINTFSPKLYLSRKDITVIRPMVFIKEKDIIGAVRKYNLPTVHNPCPVNGHTKREYVKDMIKDIAKDIPDIREKLLGAIKEHRVSLWND